MPTCAASSTLLSEHDAVTDLHQVVDLRARLDPGLAHRRPINRRIRADLDIVLDNDRSGLRNLDVGPVGSRAQSRSRRCRSPRRSGRRRARRRCTRSRIETCACTHTVGSDRWRPGRSTACGWRTVRAPSARPGRPPRTGRSRRWRRPRHPATAASGCTPDGGRSAGISSGRGVRKRRRTARRAEHGTRGGVDVRSAMTALARVRSSARAYFMLARNVRSPGPACSIVATRTMFRLPSPSNGQPSAAARSASVTRSRISRRSERAIRSTKRARCGSRRRSASLVNQPIAIGRLGHQRPGQSSVSAGFGVTDHSTSRRPRRAPRNARKWPTTVNVKK